MKKQTTRSKALSDAGISCTACGARLDPREVFEYQGKTFCESCCMDARMPLKRKTHWQYLHSIRSNYLRRPGE